MTSSDLSKALMLVAERDEILRLARKYGVIIVDGKANPERNGIYYECRECSAWAYTHEIAHAQHCGLGDPPETVPGPAVPESGLGEPKLAYDQTSDLRAVVREHFGVTETASPTPTPSAPQGELRACPLCACHETIEIDHELSDEGWTIRCANNDCAMRLNAPTKAAAEAKWNRRTPSLSLGETAGAIEPARALSQAEADAILRGGEEAADLVRQFEIHGRWTIAQQCDAASELHRLTAAPPAQSVEHPHPLAKEWWRSCAVERRSRDWRELCGRMAAELDRLCRPTISEDKKDAALNAINAIRNSIVGAQTINWSEHIYPLVAALNEAGYVGMEYPEAREYVGSLIDRAVKAEDENKTLKEQLSTSRPAVQGGGDAAVKRAMETLASALLKFAPDLADQLAERWKEADSALDDFLLFLRSDRNDRLHSAAEVTILNCPNCGGTHYGVHVCPFISAQCVVCGNPTVFACSDCAIDSAGKASVHVCDRGGCRTAHEVATHNAPVEPKDKTP